MQIFSSICFSIAKYQYQPKMCLSIKL